MKAGELGDDTGRGTAPPATFESRGAMSKMATAVGKISRRILGAVLAILMLALPAMAQQAPAVFPAEMTDWYRQQGEMMVKRVLALLEDANYLQLYGSQKEGLELLKNWKEQLSGPLPAALLYPMPGLEAALAAFSQGEDYQAATVRGLGEVARAQLRRAQGSLMVSAVNARQQQMPSMLAALAAQTSKMVEKPQGFRSAIVLYPYEGFVLSVMFGDEDLCAFAYAAVAAPQLREILDKIAP